MAATGASKTTVWRWRARFMERGVDGLLRDGARPGAPDMLLRRVAVGEEGFEPLTVGLDEGDG